VINAKLEENLVVKEEVSDEVEQLETMDLDRAIAKIEQTEMVDL
jgi:hypothetical protein